ncbi:MAG: glutamate-5-semialdehyde dehydrogenase [Nitrospirota bacterium]|nr:MAG: glutamate-5-semialdehyde dehydrogenase [Nitrospirota bacterium]
MVEVPVKMYVQTLAKNAKKTAGPFSQLPNKVRSQALLAMIDKLSDCKQLIIEANRQDLEAVSKELEPGAYRQALDRIRVTEENIDSMMQDLQGLHDQPDPLGEITRLWCTSEGMQVSRVRVPLGVLAVISDMGPSITVQSFAICLKTGNVCIFRGGTEWFHTNVFVSQALREAAEEVGVPSGALTFVDRSEPEAALELVRLTKWVDAVIPRGKGGLRKGIMDQARVPVIGYDGGVSHMYIDEAADIPLGQTLAVNAKIQDSTASNSVDTVLIHKNVARHLLPGLLRRCLEEFKVEIRGCPKTVSMMGIMEMSGHLGIKEANDQDWGQKHQSMVMSIKIVKDLDEALEHIAQAGPGHTASIVTRDYDAAMRFTREVAASAVLVNASTRVHSGEQFELGAQIGMNVTPFHARGPLTLNTLTSEKYVVFGAGHLQHPHPVPQAYEDAMMMSPRF